MMRRFVRRGLHALLAIYPASFLDRFGHDMEAALDDRLDDVWSAAPWSAPFRLGRMALDVGLAAVRERLRPAFHASSHSDAARGRSPRGSLVSHVLQDLRFALRSLARRPAFTATALFTLAVGLGSITAVYTVVDGVLLQPLPLPESEELMISWAYDAEGEPARGWMAQFDIDDIRGLPMVQGAEGLNMTSTSLTGVDRPEQIDISRVTGGLLTLMEVPPLLGRDLTAADNDPNAPRVVVISHRLWQTRLGGDPNVVGSTIELSESPWEIIGVAPPEFEYPTRAMLWMPYRLVADNCGRGCHVYAGAIIRLTDGTTLDVAQQALSSLASSLAVEYPDTNTGKGLWMEPLIDYEVGDVRVGLWVVMGAVGLVLLIVCANTANLLLVRASARGREVAVRAAMGASRRRLFGQVATESLLLAGLGGVLGLLLSLGMLEGIRVIAADRIPRMAEVGLNMDVLMLVGLVTIGVSVVFGFSPALHLARRSGADHLLGGARGGSRGAATRLRSLFLAGEVAFSVVLLAGSGLLLRSLDELYDVDLGFSGENVTRFGLNLPRVRYGDLDEISAFYRSLEERLAQLPGVEHVGTAYGAPLRGGAISGAVLVEGRPEPEPGQENVASVRSVTPGYFETMGMTVLRGRGIEPTDLTGTEPVTVVNETFVAQNFPGEEVIGAQVRVTADFGFGSPYRRVVGVVRDVRRSLSGEPSSAVYPPHSQFGSGFMAVHVRARPGTGNLTAAIREEVSQADPNLVLRGFETVEEAKYRDTASTRLFLTLVTIFAAIAVMLAAVGLYGVVAFLVAQRTREIGIRMALGARRGNVTGLVVQQGLRPTLLGLVVGVLISLRGGQVMEGLLFGVTPTDPIVLVGVSALVVLVAVGATLLPARRATRIAPTEALAAE